MGGKNDIEGLESVLGMQKKESQPQEFSSSKDVFDFLNGLDGGGNSGMRTSNPGMQSQNNSNKIVDPFSGMGSNSFTPSIG